MRSAAVTGRGLHAGLLLFAVSCGVVTPALYYAAFFGVIGTFFALLFAWLVGIGLVVTRVETRALPSDVALGVIVSNLAVGAAVAVVLHVGLFGSGSEIEGIAPTALATTWTLLVLLASTRGADGSPVPHLRALWGSVPVAWFVAALLWLLLPSSLLRAADIGWTSGVRLELALGRSPSVADDVGHTAVMHALDHVETMMVLVDAGADLTATENGGHTALDEAADRCLGEAVEQLAGHGARATWRALVGAARCRSPALITRLLASGATLDVPSGAPPAICGAAEYGPLEVVDLLLAAGASRDATCAGASLLDVARRSDDAGIAARLDEPR